MLQVKNVDSTFTVQLELKKAFTFCAILVLLKQACKYHLVNTFTNSGYM